MGKANKKLNPLVKRKVLKDLPLLFLKRLRGIVEELSPPYKTKRRGRKPHPPKAVAAINVFKEGFKHTYMSVEAEIRSNPKAKKILKVKEVPSKSAIHRGAKKLPESYIRLANKLLIERVKREGIIIVDATGFTLRNSSTWFDIRIGRDDKKKQHSKLHIAACYGTGIIVNYTVTEGKRHDSPEFERLMKVFKWLKMVIGDPAYLSRKNCNIVATKGGKPFFLPKKGVTTRAKSSRAWKEMINFFRKLREVFLEIYHLRSFIEGVFSSIKKGFNSFVRALGKRMQNKEIALKVLSYNIRQVLYVKTAKKLGVDLYVKV